MGYIPYAAGGIALKDRRILSLVSYSAAYVFENQQNPEMNLGSVILEGSNPAPPPPAFGRRIGCFLSISRAMAS